MVTKLVDDDIRKQILGWGNIDEKDINETIGFVEAKKMAHDDMTQSAVDATVSS